jgi:hypothetical protein
MSKARNYRARGVEDLGEAWRREGRDAVAVRNAGCGVADPVGPGAAPGAPTSVEGVLHRVRGECVFARRPSMGLTSNIPTRPCNGHPTHPPPGLVLPSGRRRGLAIRRDRTGSPEVVQDWSGGWPFPAGPGRAGAFPAPTRSFGGAAGGASSRAGSRFVSTLLAPGADTFETREPHIFVRLHAVRARVTSARDTKRNQRP